MFKKYIKELISVVILVFIVSNVIGYFRGSSVVSSSISKLDSYQTLDGKSVKDILNSKKVVVLNFWGTWCPICNQEVSTLSKLAKKDDIVLLTIAVNSGSSVDIKKYMQNKNINFMVVNDKYGELSRAFNISVFPTTITYSKDLKESIKDSGYTTYAGFLARVKYMESKND